MSLYSTLARDMAHQMIDRSAISRGQFTQLSRHRDAPARTVTLHFKMPVGTTHDSQWAFEKHLEGRIHKPNKHGYVNVTWMLPCDETAPLPLRVQVTFRVPTFSDRFFRGKAKAAFIDRHAFHLVAKAIASDLSGPGSKQLAAKLRQQFPDKRHPFDRFLRRVGQAIAEKASNLWWELKPLPRDKYRNYR